jgi:hypothetical protein
MNVSQFVAKWREVELTERSASHQHFLDLCSVFDHPHPVRQIPLVKTSRSKTGAAQHSSGKGWADVWKRGFFGWEYKGNIKISRQHMISSCVIERRFENHLSWLFASGSVCHPYQLHRNSKQDLRDHT